MYCGSVEEITRFFGLWGCKISTKGTYFLGFIPFLLRIVIKGFQVDPTLLWVYRFILLSKSIVFILIQYILTLIKYLFIQNVQNFFLFFIRARHMCTCDAEFPEGNPYYGCSKCVYDTHCNPGWVQRTIFKELFSKIYFQRTIFKELFSKNYFKMTIEGNFK